MLIKRPGLPPPLGTAPKAPTYNVRVFKKLRVSPGSAGRVQNLPEAWMLSARWRCPFGARWGPRLLDRPWAPVFADEVLLKRPHRAERDTAGGIRTRRNETALGRLQGVCLLPLAYEVELVSGAFDPPPVTGGLPTGAAVI